MIDDDSAWSQTLTEASNAGFPSCLREMFSYILLFCQPSDPLQLWIDHRHHLIEDHVRSGCTDSSAEQKALHHINSILSVNRKSLTDYNLPHVSFLSSSLHTSFRLISSRKLKKRFRLLPTLTAEQLAAAEGIRSQLRTPNDVPKIFFIDGPGGTGKTYIYNYLNYNTKVVRYQILRLCCNWNCRYLASRWQNHTFYVQNSNPHVFLTAFVPYLLHLFMLMNYDKWEVFLIDEASMLSLDELHVIDRMLRDITGK